MCVGVSSSVCKYNLLSDRLHCSKVFIYTLDLVPYEKNAMGHNLFLR